MIKRIRVIGIGTGQPEDLTGQAIAALRTVDVILVADEGEDTSDLLAARQAICATFIPEAHPYRVVEVPDPRGSPDAQHSPAAYSEGVRDGHAARVDAYADAIDALAPGEQTVGFLVWGDPAFYDSSIRIVDALVERFDVEHDVIPGISAPQLLAAAHRIPLGRIGGSIHLTTGRRLVDEYDPALGDVVVMLDGHLRCRELVDLYPETELFWGAYLGTADEILVSGPLPEVIQEVQRVRAAARQRRGWVNDTYLLRAPEHADAPRLPAWPQTQWLSDDVVGLRPMTAPDWPVLLAEHNDEESLRWDFTGEVMTEADARRQAAQAPREWRRGRAARWVVVDVGSGQGAGVISVVRMGPPDVGLIGYGVLPQFRGRGIASRGLGLLADWVLRETSIGRLELGHKVDNAASGRVALRAGFALEGVHAGRLRNPDGTFADEAYYARLRPGEPEPAAST